MNEHDEYWLRRTASLTSKMLAARRKEQDHNRIERRKARNRLQVLLIIFLATFTLAGWYFATK